MSEKREAKLSKRMRELVSFVLFVLIVLLSITACAKASFLNEATLEKQFTGFSYSSALRDDITQFVFDVCDEQGISKSNIENVFSYSAINNVIKAYYGHYISDKMEYSEESYKILINDICEEYKANIQELTEHSEYGENPVAIQKVIDEVNKYFLDAVEMPKIDKLHSVMNICNIALYVVIGVCSFFVISLIVIEYFIGTKRQRSVRAIGISFLSAGVYELCLVGIIYFIFKIKSIDVFPQYLSEQIMNYVMLVCTDIVYCASALILISLVIMAIVWKIRKKD